MIIHLSKSAIEAAIVIINYKGVIDNKNKTFLESVNSNLDYTEGKKIVNILGKELILEYSNSQENKKLIMRKILKNFFLKNTPGYIYHITKGRDIFKEYINDNIIQLFNEAELFNVLDASEESKTIMQWWDEIIQFVRQRSNDSKLLLGREGEKKSFDYESKKLIKLKSNKKPHWASLDNNLLGYDIQSWDEKMNQIFIEAKASSKADGIFYLSRNEWNTSLEKKNSYFIHIWIQNQQEPKILSYENLSSKKYNIKDSDNAEWTDIRITP